MYDNFIVFRISLNNDTHIFINLVLNAKNSLKKSLANKILFLNESITALSQKSTIFSRIPHNKFKFHKFLFRFFFLFLKNIYKKHFLSKTYTTRCMETLYTSPNYICIQLKYKSTICVENK